MPYKDLERRKEYKRNWHQENKERIMKRHKRRRKEEIVYRLGGAFRDRKGIPIKIRRAIVERADGQCEAKSAHTCKGRLGIHHIDGNPENNELSNLLLACNSYHVKNHGFGTEIRGGERDDKGRFARDQPRSLE